MNSDNSNYVSLKNVKVEDNTNDYYNMNDYLIENKPIMNLVPKVEIKCKHKCFDIVDKWIARVVVEVPTGNDWHNIVAREIALLKVRYPFLSERQLRGKALTKFGLPSMCGNLVRTGAGKVTKAIAIELSRKNVKTKRVPAAFKVLKSFLPCMKKFDEKPEANMWVRENHRISTLYNRKTIDHTEVKTIMKPEIMKNHWKPSQTQGLVINPMNKLSSSHLPWYPRSNNTFYESSCSVLTPREENHPIPAKKAKFTTFNVTDTTVSNENGIIEPVRRRIKKEVLSPDRKQCLYLIANDFKENLCLDDSENKTLNEKRPKKEMRTYLQLSQESRDILDRLQHSAQSQELIGFGEDNYGNQIGIHPMDNSHTNFKQYYPEFSPGRYESESFIPSYKRKSSLVSVYDYPPSSSQRHSSSQNINRRYSESINAFSTPRDYANYNDYHDFDNFDEPVQFETRSIQYSKLSTANNSFKATPLSEKLSSLEENDNHSGISMIQQCLTPFNFEPLSIPDTTCSFSSNPRSCDGSLKCRSEEIMDPNVDCKSFTNSIESETMCTLTPEPTGLSSARNSPRPSPQEIIAEAMSPDLLDRKNITLFSLSQNYSVSSVNTRAEATNHNTQPIIKHKTPKSLMLSNFCSEYDSSWRILGHKTTKFTAIENVLVHRNASVSITTIRGGIQNAIKILDTDIDCIHE